MKLIAVLMIIGLVSCGAENDKSDSNKQQEAKPVEQVTNKSAVPAAEAQNMPKTLIARVEVDASGKVIGQPETRGFEGSTSQFADNNASIANAFDSSNSSIAAQDLDKDTSTSQHYYGNRGWRYYNRSYYSTYSYPSSYYRYYYYRPAYRSYRYVNYSYSSYYRYNNYRYYCYSPYYY